MTRVVLLLALLFGVSTDSSSSTSATVFLYQQSFCLFSTVTTAALKLRTVLVFTLVLSFALVLAFLAPCLHTQRRFPLALLPLSLNGLAAMTVSQLSNFPLSASCWRSPVVHHSNRCVLSSGGTLSRSTAHLTCTSRASPLEVSYSPASLSNTIIRSVTTAGSCPKSKCMISCSCARERACERGLYFRTRSRNACTLLGCCRMICSAGPLVNMTSRYLSCASMSWFEGSLGIQTFACAANSVSKLEVNH